MIRVNSTSELVEGREVKSALYRSNLLLWQQVIVESCNMWSYGLDPGSIRLTVVKVVVRSEGTCNNCLFIKVFKYFLKCSNEIFDFLTNDS